MTQYGSVVRWESKGVGKHRGPYGKGKDNGKGKNKGKVNGNRNCLSLSWVLGMSIIYFRFLFQKMQFFVMPLLKQNSKIYNYSNMINITMEAAPAAD